MKEIAKVKILVGHAIAQIDKALADENSEAKTLPKGHLEICKKDLTVIFHELESNVIKEKSMRTKTLGRMIVDSWPLKSLLAEDILAAEQAYLDLEDQQSKPKKSLLKKGVIVSIAGFAINLTFILSNISGLLRELSRLAVLIGMAMMIVGAIIKFIGKK